MTVIMDVDKKSTATGRGGIISFASDAVNSITFHQRSKSHDEVSAEMKEVGVARHLSMDGIEGLDGMIADTTTGTSTGTNGVESVSGIHGGSSAHKPLLIPIKPTIDTVADKALRAGAESINSTNKSVTKHRKDELLLAARNERVRWILQAPLPYNKSNSDTRDDDTKDERLAIFKSSHIVTHMPSAISILNLLYSSDEQQQEQHKSSSSVIGDRMQQLLGESIEQDKLLALPTGRQILLSEIQAVTLADSDDVEASFANKDKYNQFKVLKAYESFLTKLQDPVCGTLIQSMRSFCRNICEVNNVETLASKLKSYVTTTLETLKAHVAFRKRHSNGVADSEISPTEEEEIRRSLESFVYAHCYSHIEKVLLTTDEKKKENEFFDKLKSLQFVQPKHLEIHCLEDPSLNLEEILKDCIAALRSVEQYYSVYEKLQRILALYRAVNVALSEALNQQRKDQQQPRKLPSADDILPTIIYVVLRSQAHYLLMNLKLVEEFSPPEHLRGEAGYAYTNLYGAVQFLHELNMKDEPQRLSMSPDEYREGLKRCQAQVEEKLSIAQKTTESNNTNAEDKMIEQHLILASRIPPIEIRLARLRGEVIDMDWALQWHEKNGQNDYDDQNSILGTEATDMVVGDKKEGPTADQTPRNKVGIDDSLPVGFHRNYSFLTVRPEDIRISDLPILLEEYRMLVRTTETLLAERSTQAMKARKAKTAATEQELFATAQQIDPLLLPSPKSKK